jgi:hypothetical protein
MRAKLIAISILIILLITQISVGVRSNVIISEPKADTHQYPLMRVNTASNPIRSNELKNLDNVPLAFTENLGQLKNDDVRFYTQGGGVWFTDDGMWMEIFEKNNEKKMLNPMIEGEIIDPNPFKRIVLKQTFIGMNNVKPEGRFCLDHSYNFFYGNESSKWQTEVPNYHEIYYKNIYDGIDLRYYVNEMGLKYDFIIHPGADMQQIRIIYEGADKLRIDDYGNLIIKTPYKEIIDGELFIYQDIGNVTFPISGKFVVYDDLEYTFELLDDYNTQEILVIDPNVKLEYSTYVGGTNYDYGNGIAVDSMGNAFVIGETQSFDFPTTPGANDTSHNSNIDIFVLKLNPSGSSLVYSTFIGGSSGEFAKAIDVDSKGNAYLTGYTYSSNFPTTFGTYDTSYNGFADAFIVKLDQSGSNLLYSTYIGDTNNDYSTAIKINSSGRAFITGYTYSSNFPTTGGAYDTSYNGGIDSFILILNPSGSALNYSTFIGGASSDYGRDIAIDSINNITIIGSTLSSDFPTTTNAYDTSHNGMYDVFILRLNQNGSALNYSTFLGGTSSDFGQGLKIDSNRNAIGTGFTLSSGFPKTTGVYDQSHNGGEDIFITKLNQYGSSLIFSTFIGGSGNDQSYEIALDSLENIYATGNTKSSNFPTTPDALDLDYNSTEGFMIKVTSNGSKLLYSTYFGGTGNDKGNSLAIELSGNIYITGDTDSSNFPTTTEANDTSFNGGNMDAFVLKLSTRPFIKINSLELLNHSEPTSMIYSRFSIYTFRINIIDTANVTDLNIVRLTLDPIGSNIRLTWNRLTGQFSKLSDPNNYITLESSSKSYVDSYLWIIDFNVTFNWNYPDENLNDVQIYTTSATFSPLWFNETDFFQVENDLMFNGVLVVKDEDNKALQQNDLVRGGEKLNWTGLTAVYENTTNIFPPINEYNISIKDEKDNTWVALSVEGEPINIETVIPSETDIDGDEFNISIINVPLECSDKSEKLFNLRIDGDNLTFSDLKPSNSKWQTISDVLVAVNITDIGGGVVNGSSIMHSISTNNGTTWLDWESVPGIVSDTNLIVQDVISFGEGSDNLIKWRAFDSVDNGPTISEPSRVLVDTDDITFSNEWPAPQVASPEQNVEFGISISDATSGVNASTIEFVVSTDKGNTWTKWMPVIGIENGKKVDITINYTFENGSNNRIKWRAYDIAGNGPTESQRYLINVDATFGNTIPSALLISPPKDLTINKTSVLLSWELEDKSMEGITYDLYFDNITPPQLYEQGIENNNYTVDDLTDGEIYYWRIVPNRGELEGVSVSGVWWFKIETDKSINIEDYKISINGIESISMYPGENKSVILTITNLGVATDDVEMELNAGDLGEFVLLNDYSNLNIKSKSYQQRNLDIKLSDSIKNRIYVINIDAISLGSGRLVRDSHSIALEIKSKIDIPDKPKPNGTDNNDTTGNESNNKPIKGSDNILVYSGITIVILIIFFIAVFVFITKRKKRIEQELLPPGTFAIKPGALPSKVITLDQVSAGIVSPQLSTPSVSVPQLVKSTQVPKSTIAQSTAQIPQPLPQLPPAQIPEQDPQEQVFVPTSPTLIPSTHAQGPTPLETPTISPPSVDTTLLPTIQTQTVIPTNTTPPTPQLSEPQSTVVTPSLPQPVSTLPGPIVHLPEVDPQPNITENIISTPISTIPTLKSQITQQEPIPPQPTPEQPTIPPPLKNCPTCAQPLTFYSQNNKYYCHQCQKYE